MFDLLKECENAAKIAISGHIRPDGDCVGSAMALFHYLKKTIPTATVEVLLEEVSPVFRGIHEIEKIQNKPATDENYDVFFVLDCDKERLGDNLPLFEAAKKTINIDHHISSQGCADINYLDPRIGSTSEMVYLLFEKQYVDVEIAKAIYIGMIHDTGVFQYSNTSPQTLRIAAELLEYGINFSQIIDETFYEKTYVQSQIMGRTLLESVVFMGGHCVVGWILKKDMQFYGVTSHDFDGIVSQLRMIKGVDCAIFLYQIGIQEYKVSLRTTDKVNAAEIAQYFGGGGHMKAAGCNMNGTVHDVINNLSGRIALQLDYV